MNSTFIELYPNLNQDKTYGVLNLSALLSFGYSIIVELNLRNFRIYFNIAYVGTVCPRSLEQFYMVTYCIRLLGHTMEDILDKTFSLSKLVRELLMKFYIKE